MNFIASHPVLVHDDAVVVEVVGVALQLLAHIQSLA